MSLYAGLTELLIFCSAVMSGGVSKHGNAIPEGFYLRLLLSSIDCCSCCSNLGNAMWLLVKRVGGSNTEAPTTKSYPLAIRQAKRTQPNWDRSLQSADQDLDQV
jgi:hypothetical protein